MEDEERLCISSCCSDWMSEMPSDLWDIPLWNLAIPGTSDYFMFFFSVSQFIDIFTAYNFSICFTVFQEVMTP